MKTNTRTGFTLIELLVVVIIVGVLAAVAIPLMNANIVKARAAEARAGLGSIRTGLRAYFAENQTHVGATKQTIGFTPRSGGTVGTADLDGRFFSEETYSLPTLGATNYCAQVDGSSGNVAPKASDVSSVKMSINHNGTICESLCPCT